MKVYAMLKNKQHFSVEEATAVVRNIVKQLGRTDFTNVNDDDPSDVYNMLFIRDYPKPSVMVSQSFNWESSVEGAEYWQRIRARLEAAGV